MAYVVFEKARSDQIIFLGTFSDDDAAMARVGGEREAFIVWMPMDCPMTVGVSV